VGVHWAFRDLSASIASPRNSLKCKNSPFAVYRHLSPQASRFDGKSDGKNSFVILFLIFTVKPDLKLLKSLQLTEFFALQIVGLGDSWGFSQRATSIASATPDACKRSNRTRSLKPDASLRGFPSLAVTKVHIR
jgi:hypothetical protein